MYNHLEIEKKWQNFWNKNKTFKTPNPGDKDFDKTKEKYYCLDMFPYPSGAGLHVGHPEGYTANDIVARYKHARGYNVLHPMGWDAFGLPAENYAIKTGTHPRIKTDENINTFRKQIKSLGISYDWDREIDTTDPEYYKWTQWIFLKMFEHGLAYEQDLPINYCPSCKTGLANEEVLNDFSCERCGEQVEKKKIRQWVLAITKYADRLLKDVDKLDWPESIKEMQRNWIGKSEGCEFKMQKAGEEDISIRVYTTRIDTVFGMTYAVLAPDHKDIDKFITKEQRKACEKYIKQSLQKSDQDRTQDDKEKTGVFTGSYVINPFNEKKVQLWIADYVLGNYGTGAVMAVPAHDERDFEFARKYDLDIRTSVETGIPGTYTGAYFIVNNVTIENIINDEDKKEITFTKTENCFKTIKGSIIIGGKVEKLVNILKKYKELKSIEIKINTGYGNLVNSGDFTKEYSLVAQRKLVEFAEEKGFGTKKINYKLRDWLFSRQRYWGEPIPLVHCDKCGIVGEKEENLPIKLPEIDNFEPSGDGTSPLTKIESFVNCKCPKCGKDAKRETNTMPQWGGSCWYYLRFMDPKNGDKLVDSEIEKYWGQVDSYVGGAEHAVLHLLYARFWHKFLFDIGVVSNDEPFYKLRNQGLIQSYIYVTKKGKSIHMDLVEEKGGKYFHKDTGEILEKKIGKMSKSLGNVVNPDDIIKKYGADSLRLYEMYMAEFKDSAPWDTKNIIGVRRFLEKVDRLFNSVEAKIAKDDKEAIKLLNKTIKKVSEDIENYKFNTAIAQMMILSNYGRPKDEKLFKEWKEKFAIILSPFVPHLTEELWQQLGKKQSIFFEEWPEYNKDLIIDDTIKIAVQVLGKVRGFIEITKDEDKKSVLKKAKQENNVAKWIKGKTIIKEIYVPKKIVNLVIK